MMGLDLSNKIDFKSIKMPKIKLSIRIVSVFGIILCCCIFVLLYKKTIPNLKLETEKIEQQIPPLASTRDNLKKHYQNKEFYEEKTKYYKDFTEKIYKSFPTYMHLEDKIVLIDSLQKNDFAGFNVSEAVCGNSEYISGLDSSKNKAKGNNANTSGINGLELYAFSLSGKYKDLSYDSFTDLISFGYESQSINKRRFVLQSVTVSFDSENALLSGEFNFKSYFVSGQETQYKFTLDGNYKPSPSQTSPTLPKRSSNIFNARGSSLPSNTTPTN